MIVNILYILLAIGNVIHHRFFRIKISTILVKISNV